MSVLVFNYSIVPVMMKAVAWLSIAFTGHAKLEDTYLGVLSEFAKLEMSKTLPSVKVHLHSESWSQSLNLTETKCKTVIIVTRSNFILNFDLVKVAKLDLWFDCLFSIIIMPINGLKNHLIYSILSRIGTNHYSTVKIRTEIVCYTSTHTRSI